MRQLHRDRLEKCVRKKGSEVKRIPFTLNERSRETRTRPVAEAAQHVPVLDTTSERTATHLPTHASSPRPQAHALLQAATQALHGSRAPPSASGVRELKARLPQDPSTPAGKAAPEQGVLPERVAAGTASGSGFAGGRSCRGPGDGSTALLYTRRCTLDGESHGVKLQLSKAL